MTQPTTDQPQQFPVPPGAADPQQPAQPVYVQPQPPAQPQPTGPQPQPNPAPAAPQRLGTAMDLDNLEREGADQPFSFILGGHEYVLTDPRGIDWKQLITAMRNPIIFFKSVMASPAEYEAFMNQDLPVWKLNAVMKGYYTHYGMPDQDSLAALLG